MRRVKTGFEPFCRFQQKYNYLFYIKGKPKYKEVDCYENCCKYERGQTSSKTLPKR